MLLTSALRVDNCKYGKFYDNSFKNGFISKMVMQKQEKWKLMPPLRQLLSHGSLRYHNLLILSIFNKEKINLKQSLSAAPGLGYLWWLSCPSCWSWRSHWSGASAFCRPSSACRSGRSSASCIAMQYPEMTN